MPFPAPTEKQARILWFSLTGLAISVLLALLGLLFWGLGWAINQLSSVLLPLAIAGVIAYLLDPVVDFLEKRKVPRARAILLVFFVAVMLVLILLATVLPKLIVETKLLIDQVPDFSEKLRTNLSEWLRKSNLSEKAREA